MSQANVNYGFCIHINQPYEQAIEKVTAALKDEGFGVLTEIDVKATLKKKLSVDSRHLFLSFRQAASRPLCLLRVRN